MYKKIQQDWKRVNISESTYNCSISINDSPFTRPTATRSYSILRSGTVVDTVRMTMSALPIAETKYSSSFIYQN